MNKPLSVDLAVPDEPDSDASHFAPPLAVGASRASDLSPDGSEGRALVAIPLPWQPIETAPKDGTEILVWREDCGAFMAKWTCVADLRTTSDKDRDELDEDSLFSWDWFGGDSEGNFRADGSEVPTHWMPLPSDPPRFAKTYCSECGGEFGPGNAGFSHCEDHTAQSLASALADVIACKREYGVDCFDLSIEQRLTDAYAEGRRDEQEELASVLPGVTYMDPPDGGAPTILEQLQRQAKDAARWLMLTAFTEKYQINYMGLLRDVDAALGFERPKLRVTGGSSVTDGDAGTAEGTPASSGRNHPESDASSDAAISAMGSTGEQV